MTLPTPTPRFVTYVTVGTPYETEVERLIRSAAGVGLSMDVGRLPSQGSWTKNCGQKATFLLAQLERHQSTVVWIDADAELLQYPRIFQTQTFEVAVRWPSDAHTLLSGTLAFAFTPWSMALVRNWVDRCQQRPGRWDQSNLRDALMTTDYEGRLLRLPQGYCKIFDRPWVDADRTEYIRHYQASRRLRKLIS